MALGRWGFGCHRGSRHTMVLIASSMFVVLAWAQLKQETWQGIRNEVATVGCAVLFLVVKWSYEWPSKFKHYDVWFKDTVVLHAHVNGATRWQEQRKTRLHCGMRRTRRLAYQAIC